MQRVRKGYARLATPCPSAATASCMHGPSRFATTVGAGRQVAHQLLACIRAISRTATIAMSSAPAGPHLHTYARESAHGMPTV
jgi:hypothetical protein|eukprot:COSAG06_NODE_1041_length_10982_cov_6.205366_3_plen_83_part_00